VRVRCSALLRRASSQRIVAALGASAGPIARPETQCPHFRAYSHYHTTTSARGRVVPAAKQTYREAASASMGAPSMRKKMVIMATATLPILPLRNFRHGRPHHKARTRGTMETQEGNCQQGKQGTRTQRRESDLSAPHRRAGGGERLAHDGLGGASGDRRGTGGHLHGSAPASHVQHESQRTTAKIRSRAGPQPRRSAFPHASPSRTSCGAHLVVPSRESERRGASLQGRRRKRARRKRASAKRSHSAMEESLCRHCQRHGARDCTHHRSDVLV